MADMVFLTKLKPEPMGRYDASTAYGINSLVMSVDGASAYISVKDVPAGTPLTNEEYWKIHTDLSSLKRSSGGGGGIYVGPEEPSDPNVKIWIDDDDPGDFEKRVGKIEETIEEFGGTVEVTSGMPQKERTVLTINPDSEEINLYTAEETDRLMEELSEEKADRFTVGNGLQMNGDALEVVPEGMYELIETFTVNEEGIRNFDRSTEPDGTKYNFKKLYFTCISPKSPVNGFMYALANGTTTSLMFNSIQTDDKGGIAQMEITLKNGLFDSYGIGAPNITTSCDKTRYVTASHEPGRFNKIYSIRVIATVDFPIGSIIKVWGLRA